MRTSLRTVHVSLMGVNVSVLPLSLNLYLAWPLQWPPFLGVRVMVEPEIAYLPPPFR